MPDTLVPTKRWARLLPFNPSSHQQVKAYIKAKRYPMPKHRTERDDLGERKDTSNDESLQKLLVGVANGDPVLEGVLTSRHLTKAAAYLADTYVHPDGRLHPIFTMRPKQRLSCVPLDHQILTARGWLGPEALRLGEPVAAYVNGATQWVPLRGIHRGRATVGDVLIGAAWRPAFRCTPDHKWLAETGELVEAQALEGRRIILAAPGLDGGAGSADWEAGLVGWALTDGTIIRTTKGTAALQIQVRKPATVAALDTLLQDVPHTRADALHSKHRYVRFYVGARVFGPLWAEVERIGVVAWVLGLSRSGKAAVWGAMMAADGSFDEAHGERFGKQRRATLDVYHALAVALGKTCNISQRPPKGTPPPGYETCFTDVQVRRDACQRATFVSYGVEEDVWCPETEGTWVCRSPRATGFTGNSASPNVMNFPKGKRGDTMKEAADAVLSSIMADEGFTLVSADWNSLHPTLIAYFADDPSYARVARLGDHSYVLSHYLALVGERAEPVDLNRPDEAVSSELSALKHHPKYAMAKIANLAGKYLQGEKNMALGTGLSIEQVRGLRRAMALAAPKVHAWRWRTLATAHAERRLTSPFGLSLPFFDVFRVKGGKVSVDRRETNEVFPDGVPVLGAEAPEASAFLPLATESGMLREVLVDLGTRGGFERDYFLLIPEHDKVILEVEDSLLDTTIRELIIPCMSREWGELGGLKVGVDVEVGKILSSCPKGCEGEGEERCPLGHMKEWKP